MKRNVLLLIADDWSPIAGCYGDSVVKTPHLDRIAREGVVFDHAFCTTPSCAASRASILTGLHSHANGQYGHTHGQNSFRTLPHVTTLPEVLSQNGVRSGIIGKRHTFPPEKYPFDFPSDFTSPGGMDELAEKGETEFIRSRVERFFKETGDQPFYLHVGFSNPHRKGRGGFDKDEAFEKVPDARVDYDPATIPVPGFLPDHPEVRQDLANYYRSISLLDYNMGLVLEEARRAGALKDTLVLILSDHGSPFPGAKACSYESGHHCPLIVWHEGLAQGGLRNDALVNWVDLFPTLLDWYGVTPHDELQGRSFLPVLETAHPEGWERTFYSHNFHGVTEYFPYRVIRERKFKYVLNLAFDLTRPIPSDLFASPTWQTIQGERIEEMGRRRTTDFLHPAEEMLFDLETDPEEAVNLASDPAHAAKLEEFRREMREFRTRTKDYWVQMDVQRPLRDWRA